MSGSYVAPGVSTHGGLDRETCRECGCDCDAKKLSELAVSGGIRIRSDNPPQRVPEGKSYECCDACNNRCIDQPAPHTRERGISADYSEIRTHSIKKANIPQVSKPTVSKVEARKYPSRIP